MADERSGPEQDRTPTETQDEVWKESADRPGGPGSEELPAEDEAGKPSDA